MISIIYANRNRDSKRIKKSLESLHQQNLQNFEVVFVDFGSEKNLVSSLQIFAREFPFLHFYHLDVGRVLWNKSKALNYGIKKASGEYIFIADTDLVFHSQATTLFQKLRNPRKFHLFRLGYLGKRESEDLNSETNFDNLKPSRFGEVNGMVLAPRKACLEINGFDEFFHFYGAEDEDFFRRLENAGYLKKIEKENFFFHIWHKSFSGSDDKLLTGNPRLKNIMRINQRHFERNKSRNIIKPLRQKGMANIKDPEEIKRLKNPSIYYTIINISARVEYFLREELPTLEGEVVRAEFTVDPYYESLKHELKKSLGKQTQPYISMKDVNDMILKEILFNYRDHNYSFEVKEDLRTIILCIEL